jgi:hypothetical protein
MLGNLLSTNLCFRRHMAVYAAEVSPRIYIDLNTVYSLQTRKLLLDPELGGASSMTRDRPESK